MKRAQLPNLHSKDNHDQQIVVAGYRQKVPFWNNKIVLPIALIFAMIGSYAAIRSFAATPVSLFSSTVTPANASENDNQPVELGIKFKSDVAGTISGIRFYKGNGNDGTHVGNLWSSDGTKLSSVTFTNETASGWQQASFATPVAIQPNTVYVASYFAPDGHYSDDTGALTAQVDSVPLHAVADGSSGPNGVYNYGSTSSFPSNGYQASNYYVDVVFAPNATADTVAPTASIASPANNAAVSGSLAINGTAADDVGVTQVTASVDGAAATTLSGTTSWTDSIDTTKLSNANHTVTITAFDAAGNKGTATLTVTVNNQVSTPTGGSGILSLDARVTRHQSNANTSITSPAFSTTQANEVVLAFISSDGPNGANSETVSSVSGAGLAWSLRARSNTSAGDSEIWQAIAPSPLSSVSVKATRATGSYVGSLTIASFAGASTTVNGAVATANATTGAPKVNLTSTAAGSWVWAVGNDYDNAKARTAGSGQTIIDQYLAGVGDTYWVQKQNSPTATSGSVVTTNDTAPTSDQWNLAAIEIVPAGTTGTPTPPPADTTAPSAPSGLTASATSSSQVALKWTASTDNVGVTGYAIYRNGQKVTTTTNTAFTDTALTAGTPYSYYVTAYDAAGNTSVPSNTAAVTTPASSDTTPPSSPTGLTATAASATRVNLSWTAATDNVGVTQYVIYRTSGSNPYVVLTTVAAPATTYTDTTALAGQSYSYQVKAQDAAGNTSANPSNTATVTMPNPTDTTPPSAPLNLAATAVGNTQVNLSWTAASDNVGVAGYTVYRGTSSTSLTKLATVTTTSFGDTGLTAGATYYYAVSAYDAAGNTSPQSSAAKVTLGSTASQLAIYVSGNKLVNGAGSAVQLHGADVSVTETACSQNWTSDPFGGDPLGQVSTYQAMKSWNINVIRIPLNEDCWLNINGVEVGGAAYQAAIQQEVSLAHQAGIYAVLDLHWSGPGTESLNTGMGQNYAPDEDHSVTFWQQVAAAYKSDPGVIFDLYNEPIQNYISTDPWNCWLNGCTASRYMSGGSAVNGTWQTAGVNQLISTIRATGTTEPILVNGIDWANDDTGWLAHQPSDPANQLIVGAHIYPGQCDGNYNTCQSGGAPLSTRVANWDATYACATCIDAKYPLLVGETGDNSAAPADYFPTFLPYANAHNWNYLAWTWDPWQDSSNVLITDWSGNSTSGEGASFKNTLTSLTTTADTTPPSSPSGLTASAASATQVNLSWTAATDNVGVSQYLVYRATGSTPYAVIATVAAPATTYSDTTAVAGQSYSYQVKAQDAAGNTSASPSNTATVTTAAPADTTPPSAPAGLTASAVSTSQINLGWTASTDNIGVAGYKIYRGTSSGSLTQIGTSATTSFGDAGLSAGTTYYYAVSAYDQANNESAKATASATTQGGTTGGGGTATGSAPMQLLNRLSTVKVYPATAAAASDSDYSTTWDPGNTGTISYDLSQVPAANRSKIVMAWYTGLDDGYSAASFMNGECTNWQRAIAQNYTIDVNSAAGGTLPTSGWTTVSTTTNNVFFSGQNLVNMINPATGQPYNWIRMNITSSVSGLDMNIDLADASQGATDDIMFVGDSITTLWGGHSTTGGDGSTIGTNVDDLIASAIGSSYHFISQNAGVACTKSYDWDNVYSSFSPNPTINDQIAAFPGKYMTFNLGTNDAYGGGGDPASFYSTLQDVTNKMLAAGKTPILPHIPWANNGDGTAWDNNVVAMNGQIDKLVSGSGGKILAGPDMYSILKDKTQWYQGAGNVHPNAQGEEAYRCAWAYAIAKNVYGKTPTDVTSCDTYVKP